MLLIDREPELEILGRAVDAALQGQGRGVLVEGEAGIGKTALLTAAAERAAGRALVLRARAAPAERDFAFGVARQLLERPALDFGPLSGAAALAALPLGLAGGEDHAGPDGGFAALHGLYWLVAELAERRPLVLVVDDAQWADAASLRWLAYLARRLEGLPVALLLGWRVGTPGAEQALRDEIVSAEAVAHLAPAPLSPEGVDVLVSATANSPADAEFSDACAALTGGNPFFVVELVRGLVATGQPPTAESISRLGAPAPQLVADEIARRLAALTPAAQALAEAAAVLDRDAELRHAAELSGLSIDQAHQAADELMASALMAPGIRIGFVHPMMRRAVYDAMPAGRKALAHRAAAALLEPDRAAVHLLRCEPAADPWVVEQLLAAAERAADRGAPESARVLLDRAVLEPAGALRPEVLLQLGRVGRLVGDAAALDVLRQAQEAARDPDLHEQAVGEQALLVGLDDRPDAAVVLLDRAIAELHDDPTRVARLAGLRDAYLLIHDGLAAQAGPLSERTVGEAGTNLGSAATLATAAAQAALLTRGTAEAAADMAVRALGGGGLDGQPGRDTLLYGWAARALLWADRGALAAPAIESAAAWAHQRAWRNGLVVAHAWRAWLAHWEGRTRDARAEAGAALGVADSVGKFGEDFALAVFVEASIDAAEMDEARLQLERHGVAAAEPPATSTGLLVLWARCRLALAEQRFAEAHHDAVTMLAVGERRGGLPLGIRPTAALAHWAVGAREHAAELLEVELAAARSWGAGSHIGVALRESGRIAGGRRGLALLHEADEVLAKSPRRLEHARTLLALGAALRRDGQRIASREQLRLALDLGAALGARALVDEAVAELRASGGRLRRVSLSGLDALTPSEHRVARMAADGLTNQQIAQALFVTRATVERHLTQVYRKLDVPSREGLGERLGTPS